MKYNNASTSKPNGRTNGKPTPEDRTFGIDIAIHSYEIENGDKTEKGE